MTIAELKLRAIIDGLVSSDETVVVERDLLTKLLTEMWELKRTRSEAEAKAKVDGYNEGRADLKRDFHGLMGTA